MPRSAPVTTGLPRKSGLRVSSHPTKKASPSICRIIKLAVLSDYCTNDSGNLEILARDNGSVLFICCLKYKLASLGPEIRSEERAIHFGNDDVTRFCFHYPLHDHQVTFMDTGIYHRVTLNCEHIGCLTIFDQILIEGKIGRAHV